MENSLVVLHLSTNDTKQTLIFHQGFSEHHTINKMLIINHKTGLINSGQRKYINVGPQTASS